MSEPLPPDSESPDELLEYAKEMAELSGEIPLDGCDEDTQNAIEYLQASVTALVEALLVERRNG